MNSNAHEKMIHNDMYDVHVGKLELSPNVHIDPMENHSTSPRHKYFNLQVNNFYHIPKTTKLRENRKKETWGTYHGKFILATFDASLSEVVCLYNKSKQIASFVHIDSHDKNDETLSEIVDGLMRDVRKNDSDILYLYVAHGVSSKHKENFLSKVMHHALRERKEKEILPNISKTYEISTQGGVLFCNTGVEPVFIGFNDNNAHMEPKLYDANNDYDHGKTNEERNKIKENDDPHKIHNLSFIAKAHSCSFGGL